MKRPEFVQQAVEACEQGDDPEKVKKTVPE